MKNFNEIKFEISKSTVIWVMLLFFYNFQYFPFVVPGTSQAFSHGKLRLDVYREQFLTVLFHNHRKLQETPKDCM